MGRMIFLKGTIPQGFVGDDKTNPPQPGPVQLNFTQKEEKLARDMAKVWRERGFEPILMSKTYQGEFKRMRIAA